MSINVSRSDARGRRRAAAVRYLRARTGVESQFKTAVLDPAFNVCYFSSKTYRQKFICYLYLCIQDASLFFFLSVYPSSKLKWSRYL